MNSAFTNSVTAMNVQSNALGAISQNVANVNTTAYKRTDSLFSTVLSGVTGGYQMYGVQNEMRTGVDVQGLISSTGYWNDVAISGEGFFVVNTEIDGSGTTYYTRSGNFGSYAYDGDGDGAEETYLVDQNGYFLQGWAADENGTVTTGTLSVMTFDASQTIDGAATTTVTLSGNIDSSATYAQQMSAYIYDNAYDMQALKMEFTPTGNPNEWTMTFEPEGGTSATSVTVSFAADGTLVSPASAAVDIAWDDGTAGTLTLDLSAMTQLAAGTALTSYTADGSPSGSLVGVYFNENGELVGSYSNARDVVLGQLALARCEVPNELGQTNGGLYYETDKSGAIVLSQVGTDWTGTSFVSGALENGNVDLGGEFTRMIMTQKAYTSASKVFQVADEMTTVVRDLKG